MPCDKLKHTRHCVQAQDPIVSCGGFRSAYITDVTLFYFGKSVENKPLRSDRSNSKKYRYVTGMLHGKLDIRVLFVNSYGCHRLCTRIECTLHAIRFDSERKCEVREEDTGNTTKFVVEDVRLA